MNIEEVQRRLTMSTEPSGKPDAWKLARPVWGWGRGETPRPTPPSMALALADSISEVGWDLNDQARCYVAWWREGKYSVRCP